jgi:hypothetical protein
VRGVRRRIVARIQGFEKRKGLVQWDAAAVAASCVLVLLLDGSDNL